MVDRWGGGGGVIGVGRSLLGGRGLKKCVYCVVGQWLPLTKNPANSPPRLQVVQMLARHKNPLAVGTRSVDVTTGSRGTRKPETEQARQHKPHSQATTRMKSPLPGPMVASPRPSQKVRQHRLLPL